MREMKDSGVEWIGEIPKDWEISSFKRVFSFDKGLPITKENLVEAGIPVLSYGQIHSKSNSGIRLSDDLLRYVNEEYLNTNPSSLAQRGDILFADTSEDYEGIGNCAYISTDTPIFAGYHTIITRPNDIGNPQYLAFQFQTDNWRSQLRGSASGIKVFTISQSMLKETTVIIPSSQTQHRIADYLDAKCAQIERAIARQQEVIEKLKEYKLSAITEAVTRGLNPDVPMKDSGIEWIGEIPEHWDTFRIAALYYEVYEEGNDDLPILSVSINTGVSDRELDDEEQDRVFVRSDDKSKYKRVQIGDLTYNMMRAWQGAFGAVRVEGMVSPAYVVARPHNKEDLDSRYIEYLLRTTAAKEEMRRNSHGIADFRLRLYWAYFKSMKICFPSKQEQESIANYIDEKSARVDSIITRKDGLISKLAEYKKSLIYEIVTGKREV